MASQTFVASASHDASVCVVPDAGPLITLAYADALDLLLAPGWPVRMVDMVWHELTRRDTPTRHALQVWMARHRPPLSSAAIAQGRAFSRLRFPPG